MKSIRGSERWCPKGCGKTLQYSIGNKIKKYPCEKCKNKFTIKAIRKYWGTK